MNECQTKPLLSNFSRCLVENPVCKHAIRFGFSYLCEHPDHKKFTVSAVTREEVLDKYQDLLDPRRQEHISEIKEADYHL